MTPLRPSPVPAPIRYDWLTGPLGRMLVTHDEGVITGLYFDGQRFMPSVGTHWVRDPGAPVFGRLRRQLEAYFEGRVVPFDLPVRGHGTAFQERVWAALTGIAAGQRVSYAELARRIDRPRAVRAVGAAVGRNPVSLLVPCHRVVGSDGSLTGYAGGIERKAYLLELEGGQVQADGRVQAVQASADVPVRAERSGRASPVKSRVALAS